jgi:hypothetical protein
MVVGGGSFVAHDLKVYVAEEKRTCFIGIMGSRKVGKAYTDQYTISFFLI